MITLEFLVFAAPVFMVVAVVPPPFCPCGCLSARNAAGRGETARMNTIEIMVFVAPVLSSMIFALSFGLLMMWLNERAERHKAR